LFLPICSCPFVFANLFLSQVVGVAYWRKHCGKMTIHEMATVSDEAFALLSLLENYWDSWSTKNVEQYKTEVLYNENTNQKKKRKATWAKFISGAWGSKQFGGCLEDLLQFNQLYTEVENDRGKVMQFMWKKDILC